MEGTEVGTVVFLRMEDGGKKEVLRGSLVFIHNNYKNHKNIIYFPNIFIYSHKSISLMIDPRRAGTRRMVLINWLVIEPHDDC